MSRSYFLAEGCDCVEYKVAVVDFMEVVSVCSPLSFCTKQKCVL